MSKEKRKSARLRKSDRIGKAGYQSAYSLGIRRHKSKVDWQGISLGEAFKSNISYYDRIQAQRLFYVWCRKAQTAVAGLAGETVDADYKPLVKPQLSPCYTSYPDTLAAPAAIGLTCFLEFRDRVQSSILRMHLSNYLENPAECDGQSVASPDSYKRLAHIVTESVQARLLLADLSRIQGIEGFLELYRQFSASQLSHKFRSVQSIINAVILYGDLLPALEKMTLHSITRSVLRAATECSVPFFDRLERSAPEDFLDLGEEWVRAVCRRLAGFLPDTDEKKDSKQNTSTPRLVTDPDNRIAPLNRPAPPSLQEYEDITEQALRDVLNKLFDGRRQNEDDEDLFSKQESEIMEGYFKAIEKAAGQDSKYEDPRFELLEAKLSDLGFQEGSIQGHPAEGHEVKLTISGDRQASGELFDRPVELCEDIEECASWARKAAPITSVLKRVLYPNRVEKPVIERLRSAGQLDPARLPMIPFSEVVRKRYRIEERVDRRGSPVLLIACDGSGSLNSRQMLMLKTLAWSWLDATSRTNIQVLAGLYHSGKVRPDAPSGPLVQWLYHPRKTPSTSKKDALRTIPTLPDTGTGVQADALSLTFMMDEARSLARGRMIYLILITDCCWNRSFSDLNLSGYEEMEAFLSSIYSDLGSKLHITLVALAADNDDCFDDLLDKVIHVAEERLSDPDAVAGEIGIYVASIMRERSKLLAK